MREHKRFTEYLDRVCEQIRWKRARPGIRKELGDHLEDQQAALLADGATEDEAACETVRGMGDALLVGSQLDRSYRPRPAWGVLAVTVVLMVLGYFARDYVLRQDYISQSLDVPRSLFFMGVAVAALMVGYFLDYTILARHPLLIGVGFTATTVLFSLFSLDSINGLPYVVYHFARYLAALIPVVFAAVLWWWPYRGYKGLVLCYAFLIMTAVLWFSLPVFIAVFYGGVCGLMLTVEVWRGKFGVKRIPGLLVLYVPVVSFLLWVVYGPLRGTLIGRLTSIINPWVDPTGLGYMGVQTREAIAASQWIGRGSHAIENVPSLADDLMLTFYIHEFGWVALAVVLVLFGILFAVSISLIRKQKSKLGRMVAAAVLSSLALQSAIYLVCNTFGWVLDSPLPLISSGNAALTVDAFMIGLLLSVFRTNDIADDGLVAPKTFPRFKITIERLH